MTPNLCPTDVPLRIIVEFPLHTCYVAKIRDSVIPPRPHEASAAGPCTAVVPTSSVSARRRIMFTEAGAKEQQHGNDEPADPPLPCLTAHRRKPHFSLHMYFTFAILHKRPPFTMHLYETMTLESIMLQYTQFNLYFILYTPSYDLVLRITEPPLPSTIANTSSNSCAALLSKEAPR